MESAEHDEEQRRRLLDVRQAFEAWRATDSDFRHSYRGSVRWRRVNGKDYLLSYFRQGRAFPGPRSAETECIRYDYADQRARQMSQGHGAHE